MFFITRLDTLSLLATESKNIGFLDTAIFRTFSEPAAMDTVVKRITKIRNTFFMFPPLIKKLA
jgi:hypothetical protein